MARFEAKKVPRRAKLPDEVAEVFQFDGEVHVVDDHIFGDFEDDRGEIENRLNTGGNEFVDDLLSDGRRNGQNGEFDGMLGDEGRDRGHGKHRNTGRCAPGIVGPGIKRSDATCSTG